MSIFFADFFRNIFSDLSKYRSSTVVPEAPILTENRNRIFWPAHREISGYPSVAYLCFVFVISAGLSCRGFSCCKCIFRSCIGILVIVYGLYHKLLKSESLCTVKYPCISAFVFVADTFSILCNASYKPRNRKLSIVCYCTGHCSDLQRRCKQLSLTKGKVSLFRRQAQFSLSRDIP